MRHGSPRRCPQEGRRHPKAPSSPAPARGQCKLTPGTPTTLHRRSTRQCATLASPATTYYWNRPPGYDTTRHGQDASSQPPDWGRRPSFLAAGRTAPRHARVSSRRTLQPTLQLGYHDIPCAEVAAPTNSLRGAHRAKEGARAPSTKAAPRRTNCRRSRRSGAGAPASSLPGHAGLWEANPRAPDRRCTAAASQPHLHTASTNRAAADA